MTSNVRQRRPGQRGRARALNAAQVGDAIVARAAGVSDTALGKRYGCSARTIKRTLARAAKAGQTTAGQPRQAMHADAAAPNIAPPTSDPSDPEAMTRDEQRRYWSRTMRNAIATAEQLRNERELAQAAHWLRIASQAGATLAKLSPSEEPPDPNTLPDMVAAADRGRAKLWDYLERLRVGTVAT